MSDRGSADIKSEIDFDISSAEGKAMQGSIKDGDLERVSSKVLTRAASRGNTALERKSGWPFDFYQATSIHPVDYRYWWSPLKTQFGKTQLTMMHATAYASDGNKFAADQTLHRKCMRQATRMAYQAFADAVDADRKF